MISKKPLFIFEMANNHNGSLEHGIRIIKEIKAVCAGFEDIFDFAFKLQYRDLSTFIHPDYANDMSIKFVKRFSETKLSKDEYKKLKDEIIKNGFISICTPFDENSVELVVEHDYDIIKIASCSFTDWPLLEKIALYNKPIIASTAGTSMDDIHFVYSFFIHRDIDIALMHCVAEYPTRLDNLQLNQIDLIKNRYKEATVGYSTHESPDSVESIKMAIAKGAVIFEKHVGVATSDISLNAYSATPEQVKKWLETAKEAFEICGDKNKRYEISDREKKDLKDLSRGIFASQDIKKGNIIDLSNVYFAIPNFDEQLLSADFSKYKEYTAAVDIKKNAPIFKQNTEISDIREQIDAIIRKVKAILKESKIALPKRVSIEISHHYGMDNFEDSGAIIINCINREYCKKMIVLLPNQSHPIHMHKLKEESFCVLYGDMNINIDGTEKTYGPGDIVLVERGVKHSFSTQNGVVFEEISTTHYTNDSYYEDEEIAKNGKRKTNLLFWLDD